MDQSNGVVMRIYPVEKDPSEPDKCRAYVGLPLGAKPVGLCQTQNGIGVIAVVERDAGIRHPHSLAMLPEDVLFVPLLGETVGEPIGVMQFGGPRNVVAVCPLYPWPEAPRKADA